MERTSSSSTRTRRLVVCALVLGFACADLEEALASSHREAPGIVEDPAADSTDVYAFISPEDPGRVTLVANYVPLESPDAGPNFYSFSDDVLYEIRIDHTGDARADTIFRFAFDTVLRDPESLLYNTGPLSVAPGGSGAGTYANINVVQTYTLIQVEVDGKNRREFVLGQDFVVAPSRVGRNSTGPESAYRLLADAAVGDLSSALGTGSKVFAGPRDDPFYVDLKVFDLLDLSSPGDSLAGLNVHSLVLEIPRAVAGGGDPSAPIGVWTASFRRARIEPDKEPRKGILEEKKLVQVARLGAPLVNELFVPLGRRDLFNRSEPAADEQFLGAIENPQLVTALNAVFASRSDYTPVPATGRSDLVNVLLFGLSSSTLTDVPADVLRIHLGIPSNAFPFNGRALEDDVVDITLQLLAGSLLTGTGSLNSTLGDGVDGNDVPFLESFPYLAVPHDERDCP